MPEIASGTTPSPAVGAPSGTMLITRKGSRGDIQKMGSAYFSRINSGIRWNMFGAILYDDIFGREHVTQFCLSSQSEGDGMIPCEKWNTAS